MTVFKFKKLLIWAFIVEFFLLVLTWLIVKVFLPSIEGAKWLNINYIYIVFVGTLFTFLFLGLYRWKNKVIHNFAESRLLSAYVPPLSTTKIFLKFFLVRSFLFLATLALLRPQLGSKMVEAKAEGIDIVYCLDVSRSMLAKDVTPNRLERAKKLIGESVQKLRGDRIGIVIFAGEAFVQLPITTDYRAASLFLNTIETNFVSTQGTAIGQALNLAKDCFDENSPAKKVVVLITDGENHEDDALATTELLADAGIQVYAVGIGSAKGGPIPIDGSNSNFLTDNNGDVVVSKFNPELIQNIANKGNGRAFVANNSRAVVNELNAELNQIEKAELGSSVYAEYQDRFQILLLPCIFLLVLEMFISERKKRLWKKRLWL